MFSKPSPHLTVPELLHWSQIQFRIFKGILWLMMMPWGLPSGYSQESDDAELHQEPVSENASSFSSVVDSLQSQGTRLPKSADWDEIWDLRTRYLQLVKDTHQLLAREKNQTLRRLSNEEAALDLNPWGPVHQSNSFIPDLGSLSFWTGPSAQTPMPEEAALAIPSHYRLAEALEIGTNQVYLKISLEDGQLFTSTLYGFHIASRLRFGLIGEFHLPQGTPIQTFHHSILSRGRINTQDIHLGPEVKPHQIQLKRFRVEELPGINRNTLWKLERLDLKYPTHFQSVEMSPEAKSQQADSEQKLTLALEQKFKSIRESIVASQLEALRNEKILPMLNLSHQQFTRWEAKHSEDPSCPLQLKSTKLLQSASLKSKIQSQANSSAPYLLDFEEQQDLENLLHATLAHGLYHHAEPADRQQVLLLYLELMEEVSWEN
jgi:hypothetical protein